MHVSYELDRQSESSRAESCLVIHSRQWPLQLAGYRLTYKVSIMNKNHQIYPQKMSSSRLKYF